MNRRARPPALMGWGGAFVNNLDKDALEFREGRTVKFVAHQDDDLNDDFASPRSFLHLHWNRFRGGLFFISISHFRS